MFVTNSDSLITVSLKPNVADLRYFKLWIVLDQKYKFEISKVFTIRYRNFNIWVCGKDSIPLRQFGPADGDR